MPNPMTQPLKNLIPVLNSSQTVGTYTSGTTSQPYAHNEMARGIKVFVNVSALGGSGTLTVTLKGVDQFTGNSYTILASTAIASTGLTVLTVYPGLTASSNVAANDCLPDTWFLSAAVGVSSATAQIDACYLY